MQNAAENTLKPAIDIYILTNAKFCCLGNLETSIVADNTLVASFIQLLNTGNF